MRNMKSSDIETINVKTCVRVATDFGTGTVQNIQRWPRLARQPGESYWFRTYGIKLECSDKFEGLTDDIGFMHRDEFFLLDAQYRPITPDNVLAWAKGPEHGYKKGTENGKV